MTPLRLLLMILCLTAGAAMAAGPSPFKVGLLPTLSARALLTNYQPLRTYLERELGRPVEMSTTVDFPSFYRSTMAGDYDLVVTAPHLARLAQVNGKFRPLATYAATNRAVFIVAKAKPVKTMSDLRGQTLAVFDRTALTVLQGLRWLEDQGLRPDRDFRLLETPSHNSVAYSVVNGESLMGITAPAGIKQWPDESRDNLAIHVELPPLMALVWVAHPRVNAKMATRLQQAMLNFPNTPEGRRFLDMTGYKGLQPVEDKAMRDLDGYAREAAKLMQAQP